MLPFDLMEEFLHHDDMYIWWGKCCLYTCMHVSMHTLVHLFYVNVWVSGCQYDCGPLPFCMAGCKKWIPLLYSHSFVITRH